MTGYLLRYKCRIACKLYFRPGSFPTYMINTIILNTSLCKLLARWTRTPLCFVLCATLFCCYDCHFIKQPVHINTFPEMDFCEGRFWLQSASENLVIFCSPHNLMQSPRFEVLFKYLRACFVEFLNSVVGLCIHRKDIQQHTQYPDVQY